jgi:hypothetical protein
VEEEELMMKSCIYIPHIPYAIYLVYIIFFHTGHREQRAEVVLGAFVDLTPL